MHTRIRHTGKLFRPIDALIRPRAPNLADIVRIAAVVDGSFDAQVCVRTYGGTLRTIPELLEHPYAIPRRGSEISVANKDIRLQLRVEKSEATHTPFAIAGLLGMGAGLVGNNYGIFAAGAVAIAGYVICQPNQLSITLTHPFEHEEMEAVAAMPYKEFLQLIDPDYFNTVDKLQKVVQARGWAYRAHHNFEPSA